MSIPLIITADHAVPVEPLRGSAVLKVVTGGTVYYGSTRNVSSTSNDGSITVGNSHTFTTPAYLISTARADCTVTITDTISGQLVLDANGNPTAPTPSPGDSSTRLATTAFVANAAAPGAVTLISDKLLAAPAASFDFTTIPGTYKHLRLFFSARTDVAANNVATYLQFNADTTAGHYFPANVGLYGADGGTAQLNQATPSDKIFLGQGIGTTPGAGRLQAMELTVVDYASAVLGKGVLMSSAASIDVAAGFAGGGVFNQTAAITELTIFPNSGNFITGSRASLYGIS